ncbi:hypothetical protein TrCOL_g3330 [Triparma columacea]|uniref:Fe2OG dioxygenase domain-containing protein n=1 Tax=Triparma columacea TaxID=722753 RepID=A0A9W7G4I2_9STRA|nr:hypothetical protein TrCOL_g3330 [Triparma columacea]
MDEAFKVTDPSGKVSFHENVYRVSDNDRNAELDESEGKLRVLYSCREIIVSRLSGFGVRMSSTGPRFSPSSLKSDPVIIVPPAPSSYSTPFDYYLCRRYGELEMSSKRWMSAMSWYRVGEYNALKASSEENANPGLDKHAQAACLRMMGEHSLARKCWEDGRSRYPSDEHIKRELERIMAYESPSEPSSDPVPVTTIRPNYVYLSSNPLLTVAACEEVIKKTEAHCLTNGWTTARHYAVPTTDVPVSAIPSLLNWFNGTMHPLLASFVKEAFGVNGLIVHDAFVVKYDAREGSGGAVELPWHFDESSFSFTLSLNSDFTGGGTEFARGGVVNPGVGEMVGFRGDKCWHCGRRIAGGVRYILVVFCFGGGEGGRIKEGFEFVRGDGEEERGIKGGGTKGGGEGGGGGGFSFGFDV